MNGLQANIEEIKRRFSFVHNKNLLCIVKNPNAVLIAQNFGVEAIEVYHECYLDEKDVCNVKKKLEALLPGARLESWTDLDATLINNSMTRYSGELKLLTIMSYRWMHLLPNDLLHTDLI